MQQREIEAPTKLEMRIAFELALQGAKTQAIAETIQRIVLWHELAWQEAERKNAEGEEQGMTNGYIKTPEL